MISRLLDVSEKEYERVIQRLVTQRFEAIRGQTDIKVPWIDDLYYPEQHDALQQRVLQALRCRRWAESELPPWALPLPLSLNDCTALYNGLNRGSRRGYLIGQYGILLRGRGWEWKCAPPFEEFCAQVLRG